MQRVVVTLALLSLAVLAGCSPSSAPEAEATPPAAAPAPEPAAAPEAALPEIDVAGASALFTSGRGTPVDANAPATRAAEGVVPGAVLLSSPSGYDLSELPAAEGTLVFYCANEYCTASHRAAEKARAAGREVAVMTGGISGWKQAGQSTVPPAS